jgi:hypothetical protein
MALACGLAILVAGSIQLLRIKHSEPSTLAERDSAELSTVKASVLSSEILTSAVRVVVRLTVEPSATAPLGDAGAGWTLLTGGLKQPVLAVADEDASVASCAGLSIPPGQVRDCALAFSVVPTSTGTTFVTYRFVGHQATWTLSV